MNDSLKTSLHNNSLELDRHPIDAGWVTSAEGDVLSALPAPSNASTVLARCHLKSPVLVRTPTILKAVPEDVAQNAWIAKIASATRQIGGLMLVPSQGLNDIPLRSIPACLIPVESDAMPDAEVLASADAIELQLGCWATNSQDSESLDALRLIWPQDTPDLLRLAKKIELVRALAGGQIPVGVAIPLPWPPDKRSNELRWLLEIGIDFVTVRTPPSCLKENHPALAHFPCDPIEWTSMLVANLGVTDKRSVELILDYPWRNGYQAAQALRAGASMVTMDGFLTRVIRNALSGSRSHSADSLAQEFLGKGSGKSLSTFSPAAAQLERLDFVQIMSNFIEQTRAYLEL